MQCLPAPLATSSLALNVSSRHWPHTRVGQRRAPAHGLLRVLSSCEGICQPGRVRKSWCADHALSRANCAMANRWRWSRRVCCNGCLVCCWHRRGVPRAIDIQGSNSGRRFRGVSTKFVYKYVRTSIMLPGPHGCAEEICEVVIVHVWSLVKMLWGRARGSVGMRRSSRWPPSAAISMPHFGRAMGPHYTARLFS
jgi:hypothetical protein